MPDDDKKARRGVYGIILTAIEAAQDSLLTAVQAVKRQNSSTAKRLAAIEATLKQIVANQDKEQLMNEETKQFLKRIDDATSAVAARLQAVIDKVNSAGSVSAAEVNAALGPLADHLEALGRDPDQPVPALPAAEQPAG